LEGNLLHRDTEEGKKIVAEQEAKRVAEERAAETAQMLSGGEGGDAAVPGGPKKVKILKNTLYVEFYMVNAPGH
jgi:hypothetical protein